MERTDIYRILGIVVLTVFLGYVTFNYLSVSDDTITVGYLPSNHHSALFVADELDYFDKQGIKVQMVPFRSGVEIVRAMETGQIDIAYCGLTPVTSAVDKGAPLKIIATVNLEGSGVVVRQGEPTNLTSLENKRVAIPRKGSVQDVLLRELLIANNISINNMNITELETPIMPLALENNKIDAFIAWEPYASASKFDEDGEILLYSGDWWENHPCCVIVAREPYLQDEPERVKKFLSAHVEATNYLQTNPNNSALIVAQKLGSSISLQQESFQHLYFQAYPDENFLLGVQKFIQYQKDLGYVKKNPYDTLFNFSFLP